LKADGKEDSAAAKKAQQAIANSSGASAASYSETIENEVNGGYPTGNPLGVSPTHLLQINTNPNSTNHNQTNVTHHNNLFANASTNGSGISPNGSIVFNLNSTYHNPNKTNVTHHKALFVNASKNGTGKAQNGIYKPHHHHHYLKNNITQNKGLFVNASTNGSGIAKNGPYHPPGHKVGYNISHAPPIRYHPGQHNHSLFLNASKTGFAGSAYHKPNISKGLHPVAYKHNESDTEEDIIQAKRRAALFADLSEDSANGSPTGSADAQEDYATTSKNSHVNTDLNEDKLGNSPKGNSDWHEDKNATIASKRYRH
jgi:hypothetical protein